MKTNAIVRIVIWSIVIIVLVGLLCSIIFGTSYLRSVFSGTTVIQKDVISIETPAEVLESEETLSIPADQVTDIEIEWVAGSILIQPADVDEIKISESDVTDEKYAMRWKLKGNKLSILFCEDTTISFNFGINIHTDLNKDLVIFVPRDWTCDTLEIDAAAASVEVNYMTIREVEFDGASGVCAFENCTVDTIDIDTASGDIEFYGSLNVLDFDGASGAITAVLTNTPNRLDIDGMSGDMDITLPADTGFTVSMNAMSSDFSSDFETTTKNGNQVHGDGSCRINIDAMSGDVTIRKGQ